jgi:hypothetical protein
MMYLIDPCNEYKVPDVNGAMIETKEAVQRNVRIVYFLPQMSYANPMMKEAAI